MEQAQTSEPVQSAMPRRVSDIVKQRALKLSDLRQRKARGEKIQLGVPTGFPVFDNTYGGLPRGWVSVLGADTGVGKSSIARAFCYGACGVGSVVIFNLEDGNENYADRLLGEQTGEGALKLSLLDFQENLDNRLRIAAKCAAYEKWYVDEETYSPEQQCAKVLRIHEKDPVALVVVDYVQLVRVKKEKKNEQIMEAMAMYQMLAKKCNCAVLILSQVVTKQVAKRGWDYYVEAKRNGVKGEDLYEGYVPMRGDFSWAQELDQFGKMIMSGFRVGPYKKEHGDGLDDDKTIMICMLKVNRGPLKKFRFTWVPELSQMRP